MYNNELIYAIKNNKPYRKNKGKYYIFINSEEEYDYVRQLLDSSGFKPVYSNFRTANARRMDLLSNFIGGTQTGVMYRDRIKVVEVNRKTKCYKGVYLHYIMQDKDGGTILRAPFENHSEIAYPLLFNPRTATTL